MTEPKRPRVRIRFKYNRETGEIEEFIIDDNAPTASEEYHDQVAQAIASLLGRTPGIADAGPRDHLWQETEVPPVDTTVQTGATTTDDQTASTTE